MQKQLVFWMLILNAAIAFFYVAITVAMSKSSFPGAAIYLLLNAGFDYLVLSKRLIKKGVKLAFYGFNLFITILALIVVIGAPFVMLFWDDTHEHVFKPILLVVLVGILNFIFCFLNLYIVRCSRRIDTIEKARSAA